MSAGYMWYLSHGEDDDDALGLAGVALKGITAGMSRLG